MRPLAEEGETVVIALRIPRDLKERFRQACGERAMSEVMRVLMEAHIKKEPPKRRHMKKKVKNGHRPRD